jgi:hypothetical protein
VFCFLKVSDRSKFLCEHKTTVREKLDKKKKKKKNIDLGFSVNTKQEQEREREEDEKKI